MATAPKGFKKVETGLTGFWRPTKVGQCLQGVVGHAVETKGRDGKSNTFFVLRLSTSDCEGVSSQNGKALKADIGMLVGVGGKVLHTFLSEHTGREVYLIYKGLGDAKRGQNAPKLFDVYESVEDGGS